MSPVARTAVVAGLALGVAAVASGCFTMFSTRGSLHDPPSRGLDLPFQTGLYAADGPPAACQDLGGDHVLARVPPVGRFMAFADDGGFVIGKTAAGVRAPGDANPYDAWAGTYKVVEGVYVDARAVSPGIDSGYARLVQAYALTATGPDSFVTEWVAAGRHPGDGRGCGRQRYRRTDATPSE